MKCRSCNGCGSITKLDLCSSRLAPFSSRMRKSIGECDACCGTGIDPATPLKWRVLKAHYGTQIEWRISVRKGWRVWDCALNVEANTLERGRYSARDEVAWELRHLRAILRTKINNLRLRA